MNENPDSYRQDIALVKETAQQLFRDFEIFGFEIPFSGNPFTAYQELHAAISPLMGELFRKSPGQFQAILYRIDVDESAFRKVLSEKDRLHFEGAIADLILKREFQKVITRKFFSGNS
ncbi:MAG: hypothetical protein IT242_02615 [Bacteroidia bacterium]|nr:hypothetical protein [Bacteroidia bacterium]